METLPAYNDSDMPREYHTIPLNFLSFSATTYNTLKIRKKMGNARSAAWGKSRMPLSTGVIYMNNIRLKGKLRILVAEDDALIQSAFCLLVGTLAGVELAGSASSGVEALQVAGRLRPDLILMDLKMPEMTGVEATRKIKAEMPETKVLVLTALEDPLLVTEALEAGVDGFLLKKATVSELQLAIDTVSNGEQYLSPAVSAIITRAYLDERNRKREPIPHLTPREKHVVSRIAKGMRQKQIADELEISERTVEKHSEQARRKLKAATAAEMVAIWLRME